MNLRVLLVLLTLLIWGWGSWHWYTCKIRGFCPEAGNMVQPSATNGSNVKSTGPLLFSASSAIPVVSDKFPAFADSLAAKIGTEETLEITGQYYDGEIAPKGFANMGLARAEEIKKMLIKRFPQIDPSRFKTTSKMLAGKAPAGTFDSASFAAVTINKYVEESVDSLICYFPSGSIDRIKQKELEVAINKFVGNAKSQNSDVTVIGHTDNQGEDKMNYVLALTRAKAVRELLIDKGLSPNKVDSDSKGETQPIGDNETDAGRQKNRRVVLKLKS